jgi:hypothetical protein
MRFVVELPQGNQVSWPTKTRCQQWLIHAVVASFLLIYIRQCKEKLHTLKVEGNMLYILLEQCRVYYTINY